jgi:dienelactone hydrolase
MFILISGAIGISLFFRQSFLSSLVIALFVEIFVVFGGFIIWAAKPMGPDGEVREILDRQSGLRIDDSRSQVALSHSDIIPRRGFVFYPGGRVHPYAYLPLLAEIARAGYLVVLTKMPFHMAVFDYRRANQVKESFPEIDTWVIGGHSLGGAMAAHYVAKENNDTHGLVLWGAYPSSRDDLSGLDLPTLIIYGTCDGITTSKKVLAAKNRMPHASSWECVEGGNHAQFGCYGREKRDHPAEISMGEQKQQVIAKTLKFLDEVKASM